MFVPMQTEIGHRCQSNMVLKRNGNEKREGNKVVRNDQKKKGRSPFSLHQFKVRSNIILYNLWDFAFLKRNSC